MIKGGFQGLDISGVDLTAQSPTLPGGYEACAAADGKTVLVLTASGAVQCSVKKVSTNYVLAGITGDGKILSITIGSTDGISVSESVPGEEPEVSLGNGYNFTNRTSENPYIPQYDGLVRIYNGSGESLALEAKIMTKRGSSGTASTLLNLLAGTATGSGLTCFVKKGTVLYGSGTGGEVTANYYPYEPVHS